MKRTTQLTIAILLFLTWRCSLEKIDPSVKYDPCLGKVTAKFSHDKLGVTCDSPCVVKFTNNSIGAKNYTWNFGEGGTSTETNPIYTFKKSGRFEVKLTATGDGGCINVSTEIVTVNTPITPDPIPDFTFTYLNGNQFAPATVAFTNTSQNAISYKWEFGDGKGISNQTSPQYLYATTDDFSVKLETTNSVGVKKQMIKTVSIKAITFKKFYAAIAQGSEGEDIIQTSDGGYAIVGETGGTVSLNTLKIDIKGNLLWNIVFPTADISYGRSLTQASDGGIVTVGLNNIYTGNSDLQIVKFDPFTGAAIWNKMIGGTKNEGGISIEKTSDGGFIVCGSTESQGNAKGDIYVVKVNSLGITQWAKPFTDATTSYGIKAIQTSEGGFIVLGITKERTTPLLLKLDALGNKVWSKTPNVDINTTGITNMSKTTDAGYIICGYKRLTANPAISDFFLLKTDSLGNQQWQKSYGDSRPLYGNRVEQCFDGGYVMVGSSSNIFSKAESFMYLFRMDSNGNKVWDKSFVGGGGGSVKQTKDGGFILVGNSSTTNSTGTYIIKTDKNGDVQ
jgi:PKD repeat protein